MFAIKVIFEDSYLYVMSDAESELPMMFETKELAEKHANLWITDNTPDNFAIVVPYPMDMLEPKKES